MKKFTFLFTICLFFTSTAFCQNSFEGKITCMQYNGVDTSYFSFYVKNEHVKFTDSKTDTGKEQSIILVNFKANTTVTLSPQRRQYYDYHAPDFQKLPGKTNVTKTTNTKTINGYLCTEYIVENQQEDAKISYWIADGNFTFFLPMLKALSLNYGYYCQYYLEIPNTSNMFPMEAYKTDMKGNTKGFMKATKVTSVSLEDGIFFIPQSYTKK